jgi:hypothetical protein
MPMSTLFREHVINVAHAELGGWPDRRLFGSAVEPAFHRISIFFFC